MKALLLSLILLGGGLLTVPAQAQTAAASVTATCKDGTAFSGASRRGACRGHGGVQAFNPATAAATPATPAAAAAPAPAAAAPAAAAPVAAAPAAVAPAAAAPAPAPRSAAAPAAAAPGGGPGMVWVNTGSKVYHCQGDRYYGKTKAGHYVTETAAKAAGDRPSHGKACS